MRTLLHATLVAHSTRSHGDESEQCCECGAVYKPVDCGGRPAGYYVTHHAWDCPERKLRWPA
jgi:hypothetical protein